MYVTKCPFISNRYVIAGFKATMAYEDCLKRVENTTQVNGTSAVCDFKTIISEVILHLTFIFILVIHVFSFVF
jgi:hypothetical protein